MGVAVFKMPGLEGDDVGGALAMLAARQGALVSIATSDKDFKQLVRPSIQLLLQDKNKKFVPYTVESFREEFQVMPTRSLLPAAHAVCD